MMQSSYAHIFGGNELLYNEGLQLVSFLYPNGARIAELKSESCGRINISMFDEGHRFPSVEEFMNYFKQRQCDVWIYDDDRVSFNGPFKNELKHLYMRILDDASILLSNASKSLMDSDSDDGCSSSTGKRSRASSESDMQEPIMVHKGRK